MKMSNDNDNNKDFIDMRDEGSRGAIPPEQQAPHHAPTPVSTGSGEPPRKRRRMPGWVIALIFLGIGLAVGLSNFNFNFGFGGVRDVGFIRQASDRDLTTLTLAASDVSNINVRLGIDCIHVETHNGRDIRIVYNPPRTGNYNRPIYNFNERTGQLEIFTESNLVIGINNTRAGSLRIYLPDESILSDLTLRTSTGNINVAMQSTASRLADNVSLHSTTGRINAMRVSAGSFSASSTTGRIELNVIESDNNLTVSSTTGNIDGTNLTAGRNMSVTATTGRINLTNVGAEGDGEFRSTTGNINLTSSIVRDFNNVTINASTGRITASDFNANSVNIRSTTGNINVDRIDTTSDFTATASTGRIEANGIRANMFQFTTTTGNISLDNGSTANNASFQASTGRVNISNTEIRGVLDVRTTTGNVNLTNVNTDMNRANITTNRTANVTIN